MITYNILTIDPGIHIGYAIWKQNRIENKVLHYPVAFGVVQGKDEEKRFDKFKKIISQYPIYNVYMENSALMKHSAKGTVTAESGALVKLSQTIGRIVQICKDQGMKVELIPVSKWKGTLPKDVCERRIRRALPDLSKDISNHAIDAIGIGLYIGGILK